MKPSFSEYFSHISILRDAALRAADPAAAVRRSLTEKDLDCSGRIFLVGAGKAGAAMARAAQDLLGDRVSAGVVSVPVLPTDPVTHVEYFLGGHPIPTPGSLSAGNAIARLLENTSGDDLVLVLLSGGGSAMAELPRPGIPLEDLQSANRLFLKSGASISGNQLPAQSAIAFKSRRPGPPGSTRTGVEFDYVGRRRKFPGDDCLRSDGFPEIYLGGNLHRLGQISFAGEFPFIDPE